ncbi:dihydrolipoyl dehydrogenase [Candidatus Marinamargulisbacteria bacterium SCGC AG-343-D04]|nr:dihydrolipoyl dehydrogenase [Candidatus Marinamargulisbacteria bacterium SCGC AG-343-D04]
MAEYQFDVVVIGAGPGGYVAAIRAAQCGKRVAIVEKQKTLGGTCLNWGCIPSKALLDSSEHYHMAKTKFKTHGIDVSGLKVNLKQMMKRKEDVVETTTKGIEYLMKKNKIEVFKGTATFKDAHSIVVTGDTTTEVTGENFIIATGSSVTPLPTVKTNGKNIITSDEAISLKKVPKHMVVIGGGVIGVELGSVYARLGAKVTVIEFLDRLIPGMDKDCGKALQRSLSSHCDVEFHFKTKVTGATAKGNNVKVTAENSKGETLTFDADMVLVSIGRKPNTEHLGLANVGIDCDERGRIPINDHFQTKVPNIYAIGDVVRGIMLAHKASEEGNVCAEIIAGQQGHINYNAIPNVVYTWPEVASVGKTEDECKEAGIAYKSGKFPFKASGRARAAEESEGFVKVLSDKETDEIVGIHMVGPRAADMIAEGVLAIEYRASAEDVGMAIHPHPTFTEAIKEAALAATGNRPIHL